MALRRASLASWLAGSLSSSMLKTDLPNSLKRLVEVTVPKLAELSSVYGSL